MTTKLKTILNKRNISQKKLYDMIKKSYHTPVGRDALNVIINGKRNNYQLITLVKICTVLNIKPNSIIEMDVLKNKLDKEGRVFHDGMSYDPKRPEDTITHEIPGFEGTMDELDNLTRIEEGRDYKGGDDVFNF